MRPDGAIRVLIIDDSPLFGRLLATELDRAGDIHALSVPGNLDAIRARLLQHHPEVVILDLELTGLNGLELLRRLRTHYPVPVIVMAYRGDAGAARAIRAVQRGALEAMCKPDGSRAPVVAAFASDLVSKIRMAVSAVRPVALPGKRTGAPGTMRSANLNPARYVVAIGASTGGTRAIETLLQRAPADFPATVVVQHMPAGFTRSFAVRLNGLGPLSVGEAVDGEPLIPGRAVIARGDTHLVVDATAAGWRVRYIHQQPVNRHCPSVDVLFEAVAASVGRRAVGILLTGMGDDGARGLLKIRMAGGATIAQDRASCVVYGMPKVAVDLGATMYSAAPEDVPALVVKILAKRSQAPTEVASKPAH